MPSLLFIITNTFGAILTYVDNLRVSHLCAVSIFSASSGTKCINDTLSELQSIKIDCASKAQTVFLTLSESRFV